jgi:hypothetical protein
MKHTPKASPSTPEPSSATPSTDPAAKVPFDRVLRKLVDTKAATPPTAPKGPAQRNARKPR